MAKHKNQPLILFDDLRTAGAHMRVVHNRHFRWVAVDKDMMIYGYNVKPVLHDDRIDNKTIRSRTTDMSPKVWSYNIRDHESLDSDYQSAIGIYTGKTPWKSSLTETMIDQ